MTTLQMPGTIAQELLGLPRWKHTDHLLEKNMLNMKDLQLVGATSIKMSTPHELWSQPEFSYVKVPLSVAEAANLSMSPSNKDDDMIHELFQHATQDELVGTTT